MEELIRAYYDKRPEEEWRRPARDRMEFAVSTRVLEAHLPPTGRVLDCGGGPGRYAVWLAAKGYEVTLFDLSQACLEKASQEATLEGLDLSCTQGTATDLSRFEDASFDAVLLLGPLYHMFELADRQKALAEARRVLRPGGLIAAAFITRIAVLHYFAKSEPTRVLELFEPMLNVIEQGFSDAFPPRDAEHFHAYFSHPDEVEPLLREAGLEPLGVYATEGLVSRIDEAVNEMQGEQWEAWVELNLRLAQESTLFSCAGNLLALARKP